MTETIRLSLADAFSPPAPAPAHLLARGRTFWEKAVTTRSFEAVDLPVLQAAAEQLDRAEQCRNRLKKDGLFVKGRFNCVVDHPALRSERAALLAFEKLRRSLNLDSVPAAQLPKIRRSAYK